MRLHCGSKKLLGYLLSVRRIKVNTDKQRTIIEMKAHLQPKEIQSLIGRIVALNSCVKINGSIYTFFDQL